ncbi:MAG: sensor histidine kinase [Candidatus Binatia bacterium]
MSAALLERPIAKARGISWWRERWDTNRLVDTSIPDGKNAIIAVQWLVAIGTSYLVFAVNDWNLTEPVSALLILICLLSAAALRRIPDTIFKNRVIEPGLLVLDSILVVCAITLSQEVPWDLLVLFFFCVFIAAIGENIIQIGAGAILLSLVFLIFVSRDAVDLLTVDPNLLFRVPFMFGISIFYGHMASQVKQEKKRMEKLEETMRLKRQFVCALAHDIKTPLNVILGHAEILAGAYGGQPDPTEQLSSLKSIRENTNRIVELITDFLTVSKLEAIKLNSAKDLVQMNVIAEDVVLQQRVIAREKNINLILELDPDLRPILGDTNQLQRVLWNLVGNAVKFTPRGGTITVASRMVEKNLSIQVKDTGVGIPEEDLAKLFSEFQRLKGAATSEGSGLGLFIVKTIVEAHGGCVSAESEPGVGTTFTILLPTSKDSRRSVQPADVRQKLTREQWSSEAA